MNCKAYAKINLSLRVLGTREDGYHELEMVNLPLELHDVIEISTLPYYNETFITCDDLRIPLQHGNLCKKAVDTMREEYRFKQNLMIHIHKEIPVSAGLGGGSSNAAAVMCALNKMLKLGASMDDLARIGAKIGADVPFFFLNKPAKVSGIGEKMETIKAKRSYYCLIIKPEQGLSTQSVYEICDKFQRRDIDTAKVIQGLAADDKIAIARGMGNDLLAPAECLLPLVGELYSSLQRDGFAISGMSGSGSALFALTDDGRKAKEAFRKYNKRNLVCILTKTLN